MKEKLIYPNFLIVGAAKSGTTSLFYWLKQHPDIYLPALKEPRFFSFVDATVATLRLAGADVDVVNEITQYRALFRDVKIGQIAGEASTTYLYLYEPSIWNIKRYMSKWEQLKIIIVLRNPIERAYSHYLDDIRTGGYVSGGFLTALENCRQSQVSPLKNYLAYGNYVEQVKAYIDTFPNIKVLLFEDICNHAQETVRDLLEFLGVDSSKEIDTSVHLNPSGVPKYKWLTDMILKDNAIKKIAQRILTGNFRRRIGTTLLVQSMTRPKISQADREWLRQYFRLEIESLGRLLRRDLSAWLE